MEENYLSAHVRDYPASMMIEQMRKFPQREGTDGWNIMWDSLHKDLCATLLGGN